MKGFM